MKNSTLKKLSTDLKFVYSDDNSISVIFQKNTLLRGVVGEFDSNLKELEKLTGSAIYFRGNSIAIKGDKKSNEKVKDAIQYLIARFKSDNKIDKNDIISSLNNDMIKDITIQPSKNSFEEIIKTPKRSVIARSQKQKE